MNESVHVHQNVDVSVAVATEGGLITPIIEGADVLTVPQISSRLRVGCVM